MRIEGGAAEGTSQGKTKRISKVVLRLFETVGVKVGPSLTELETVPFRTTSSNLSAPVDTLLAGDKEIEFRDDYNSDGFILLNKTNLFHVQSCNISNSGYIGWLNTK